VALSEVQLTNLARWLEERLDADRIEISSSEKLAGGAIQENIALLLAVTGGPRAGAHEVVLRSDAPSSLPISWSRLEEFKILQVAHGAGVTVPEPWLACDDASVIGKPFAIMGRVRGEARGVRLVRDPVLRPRGDALAERLGRELARLHRVVPPVEALPFTKAPDKAPALVRIEELRRHLDRLDAVEPVLEWGLRWAEVRAPETERLVLIHGDFRTGNYMVRDGELVAALDWEFSCFSDPLEDLGWLLARCWRFGAFEQECGGIGSRDALLRGYENESGRAVDRRLLPYWELIGTLRWGVIALMQAERHYSGREPSLELALTAHVVPALEQDILDYIDLLEEHRR
jgi:aminoglycoside phosphotransferase (APT) family kinase protein